MGSLHTDLAQVATDVLVADVANRLATPRLINGVPFDGTADITVAGGSGTAGDATSIAGIPVSISAISVGDTIKYTGASWENDNLTDGGNF